MSPVLANEAELYFERGGPIHRFVHWLFLRWGIELSVGHRIVGFLLITWVPLLILAWIDGLALDLSAPKASFLLDFGTYARFFLAVPLLIVAESVVGPRLRGAGLHFVQGGFVRPEDYPAFDHAIARVKKWRESLWAELIIVGVAVTGAWLFTTETLAGESIATWRSPIAAGGLSFTGLWYHAVAVPLLQFFWYRWLWRLIVWARFLWTVSRLKLDLVALHADRAGGLAFLGTAHASLGMLAVALSSVLSAEVAFLLVFKNANIPENLAALDTLKVPFVVLLVVVELIFLGPLLMFTPLLNRTRLAGLREYSLLLDRYDRAFHAKWIEGKVPADEPLLGSADIQSLADLGSSFECVREMKVVPFSMRVMIQMAVVTSLPFLPLMLLVMPVGKIVDLLAGAVF